MGIRGLLLALTLSGCSFLQAKSSPYPDPLTKQPTCTPRTLPVVDIIAAAVPVGIASALVFSTGLDDHSYGLRRDENQTVFALGIVLSSVFVVSAIYGFRVISTCRAKLEPQ